MAEPHLHTPDVDAALDKTRGAGVAQYVRHDLFVGAKTDLGLRIVPDGAKLRLAELGERTFGPTAFGDRQLDHLLGPGGEWNGAAAAGFGDPEADAMLLDIIPDQAQRLAEATAGVDEKDRKPVSVLAAPLYGGEQLGFLIPLDEANPSRPLLLAAELGQAVDIPIL